MPDGDIVTQDEHADMRDVLLELVAEVRALREEVRAGAQKCEGRDLLRLTVFLHAVYEWRGSEPFTAGELVGEMRSDRELLEALDAILGDTKNPAIKLGRWIERHADVTCDGLRIVRVSRRERAWVYMISG